MIPLVVINNIGRPIARPLLALAAIAAGLGGVAIALAYATPVAVGFLAALAWLLRLHGRAERRVTDEEARPVPTRTLASEFWRFAAPRAFAAVFSTTVT